jgi:hypothetical protein
MKTLALVGMVLAHTAFALGMPELNFILFFWVAPVFAAIVGINAFAHTSNPRAYSLRLLFWAVVSQPVHIWFFGPNYWYLPNILFGLSASAYLVSIRHQLPELKIPSQLFYAFYPAHFILIKTLAAAVGG